MFSSKSVVLRVALCARMARFKARRGSCWSRRPPVGIGNSVGRPCAEYGTAFGNELEETLSEDAKLSRPRLMVLFGSQTGTAQLYAEDLKVHAEERGLETDVVDMMEVDGNELVMGSIERKEVLTFVISNFGKGEPPDNARALYNWFMHPDREREQINWASLRYTLFGLGMSKAYPESYQRVGKSLDARLKALGAQRLCRRGEGDSNKDIDADFEAWEAELWPALDNQSVTGAPPSPSPGGEEKEQPRSSAEKGSPWVAPDSRENASFPSCLPHYFDQRLEQEVEKEGRKVVFDATHPFFCPVTVNIRLTPAGSLRQVHHLELDLTAATGIMGAGVITAGATYKTGDYLGVLPRNCPEQVSAMIGRLGLDPSRRIEAFGDNSFFEVVCRHCNITSLPRRSLLKELSMRATDDGERSTLLRMASGSAEGKPLDI
ncbi:unnamed protein product [Discosporangium mesarthrocarpum]